MQEVFVVAASRSPIGSFGVPLASVPAPQLAAGVMRNIIERLGLDASWINNVILGQFLQGGGSQAPARQALRAAGIHDHVHRRR